MSVINPIITNFCDYITTYTWKENNQFHRTDGPALIEFRHGVLYTEQWFQNGVLHRENGPSLIYYDNGVKIHESWFINGKIFREDGPVDIDYYSNGQIKVITYGGCGFLHRLGGPAKKLFNSDGTFIRENYYIHNKYYDKVFYKNVVWLVRKFVRNVKKRQQDRLTFELKNSALKYNGSDICRFVATFVY